MEAVTHYSPQNLMEETLMVINSPRAGITALILPIIISTTMMTMRVETCVMMMTIMMGLLTVMIHVR